MPRSRSTAPRSWWLKAWCRKQQLDDAQSKYDDAAARVASLDRTYELVQARTAPGRDRFAARAQVEQAKGAVAYAQNQLDNTVIRAPINGTILERAVEKGEFVTNGFVGDKGAKGYVVTLADLNDLQVELDINQNDFAKLHMGQKGIVTTDAYPDRKYDGVIAEISPEGRPPEGDRASEGQGAESGRLPAPGDERQRRFPG